MTDEHWPYGTIIRPRMFDDPDWRAMVISDVQGTVEAITIRNSGNLSFANSYPLHGLWRWLCGTAFTPPHQWWEVDAEEG